MKSYFLCLKKKDTEALEAENILSAAAERMGIKEENRHCYNSAREFFFRLSQISSDEALIVMAVDKDFFLNAKRMVCSVFSLKCAQCEEISRLCGQNADDLDVHSSMPEGGAVFLTEDGLFSGFAVKTEKLSLVYLPLDEKRTEKCVREAEEYLSSPSGDSPADRPGADEPSADETERAFCGLYKLLEKLRLKTCVCVSHAGAKISERFPESDAISFFTSPLKRDGNTPKTYAALLAKEAAERSPCGIGASVTKAFKIDGDGKGGCFIIVCAADGEYANFKKIYAEDGESVSSLTYRALGVAFRMLKDRLRPEEIPAAAPTASGESENLSKEKKLWTAGACVAAAIALISIFLGVGYMMARANHEPASSGVSTTLAITKDYTDPSDDRHGEVGLVPDAAGSELSETQSEENLSESSEPETETQLSSEKETYSQSSTSKPASTAASPTTTKAPTTAKPVSDGTFVFTVYGYGHGVGMSQYGANALAKQGWSYDKILTYYYTGTSVADDSKMPATLKVDGKDVDTGLAVSMAVQGEMGPSFHTEALKAQAVAVYTYAMRNGGSCDGLYTLSNPSQTVINAVNAVKGKYVSYNGTYINAVFFAYSGGNTVSSSSVWGSTVNYPYLVPVDSSSDLQLSFCKTQVRVSAAEMKKRTYDSYGVVLTGDPSKWLTIENHDNSTGLGIGYVSKISMGGKVLSGNQFRTYVMDYDIRSHCFTVDFIPA